MARADMPVRKGMEETRSIAIEVAFATPDRQALLPLTVSAGTTAGEAVRRSGIVARFPDDDLASLSLGVWGRAVTAEHVLEDGDRVEIYRPLQIDPRQARMRLAAEGGIMGSAGKRGDEPKDGGSRKSGN